MIAEIGLFCLAINIILSFSHVAIVVCAVFFLREAVKSWLNHLASVISSTQSALFFASLLSLFYCYVASDFSVSSVFYNSHYQSPLLYKITGVWGNHEGSLLLWITLISSINLLFTYICRKQANQSLDYYIFSGVTALVTLIFGILLIHEANPFSRIFPPPSAGQDLNPLLQDPSLVLHPPFLYIGYSAFVVPFSISLGSLLLKRRLSPRVIEILARFNLFGWGFLTIGIALGSYWAYYELGWGGWWFWDPVENVSLIPWLCSTALLHVVPAFRRQENTVSHWWLLLLGALPFTACLAGAILVRSGLMESVHNFTASDSRRNAMVGFFGALIIIALIVYIFRVRHFLRDKKIARNWRSQSLWLQVNSQIFCLIGLVIFFLTLLPSVGSALGHQTILINPELFNRFAPSLGGMILFMAAIVPELPYGVAVQGNVFARLSSSIVIALAIIAGALWHKDLMNFNAGIIFATGSILICMSLLGGWRAWSKKQITNKYMIMAHFSAGVMALGLGAGYYQVQHNVALEIGEKYSFQDFIIELDSIQQIQMPTYLSEIAKIKVYDKKKQTIFAEMHPEKRLYYARDVITFETALYTHHGLSQLYVILGNRLESYSENNIALEINPKQSANSQRTDEWIDGLTSRWALFIQYTPLVLLIWVGAILMGLTGIAKALCARI